MKRIVVFFLLFACVLGLGACNNNSADSASKIENLSEDSDHERKKNLAKSQFAAIFREYENVQVNEISATAKTDNAKEIVVEIRYSSGSGDGVYYFEYNLDDPIYPELIQHGENIH